MTPDKIRRTTDIADKLPDDVDLTFDEVKILARFLIDQWPKELLSKVRYVIDFEDFLDDDI